MKTIHFHLLPIFAAILLPLAGFAQVNSGSDGHDGALNPTANLVIDMADHPDGIYHYTSVNIPAGVTVSFIPNANNKPVVWLVQTTCVISGTVNVSGQVTGNAGGAGGPGGFRGSDGLTLATNGQGPGGGGPGYYSGNASFGTVGDTKPSQTPAGPTYGNVFLLPLIGGSGAGGSTYGGGYATNGGGGGGGAILIAGSTSIQLNGTISSIGGGWGQYGESNAGSGSGGGVRLVTTRLDGTGTINVIGGQTSYRVGYGRGGMGRVRLDVFDNHFAGTVTGPFTQGFQPIILPAPGQGIHLGIASLAGVAVAANPSGILANPDVIIPAQQTNPIPVVVNCTNIPLNTEITVVVHPANGLDVLAVGLNNAGTTAASTAAIPLNLPRGGGIIYARAVTGIAGTASATSPAGPEPRSLAETGWTADGERFVKMEITAALGGPQKIAYITESGKRYKVQ